MKDKRTVSILLVVALVVLVLALIIVERKKYQNNLDLTNKAHAVDNYSTFFTVDDCANRFVEYLSSGNKDNLLLILNKEYVEQNNINSSNVLDKIDTKKIYGKLISFKSKEILSKKVSDNVTKYYVSGKLYQDAIDELTEYSDYYLEINVDSETLIFDVIPLSGIKSGVISGE